MSNEQNKMTRDLFDCLMALLLSGEENQGPASDAYEVCVCKGWAEGRTVTAAGLEALKPYKVRNATGQDQGGGTCRKTDPPVAGGGDFRNHRGCWL